MLSTTTIHEEITAKIIAAIEHGQTPPWRKPAADLENGGFPIQPSSMRPFEGVDALLLNISATEKGLNSKFWACKEEWRFLDSQVVGQATILADGTPVFNADQIKSSLGSVAYRSRRRRTHVAPDYGPAEEVIKNSGATIHFRLGMEAAYYFPP